MKIVLEQLCCPSYITTIKLARKNCKKTGKLDLLVAQSGELRVQFHTGFAEYVI